MDDQQALDIYRDHLAEQRAAGRGKTYAPETMPPPNKQKAISVRVSEADWIRAFAVATQQGRTITDVINAALRECGKS